MDAQRDRSWKKTASAGWAAMCDEIDTITEMEKNIRNSRKASSVMEHTLFIQQKKSMYSHLIS